MVGASPSSSLITKEALSWLGVAMLLLYIAVPGKRCSKCYGALGCPVVMGMGRYRGVQ